MSDRAVKPYTLTVRDVEPLLVQLMRIAAVQLGVTQGDAVSDALLEWLTHGQGAVALSNNGYATKLKALRADWFKGS